jgi:hypothetical protein
VIYKNFYRAVFEIQLPTGSATYTGG